MAYLGRSNNRHRTATIVAVAAVEALAIFAVVRGLDVPYFPRAEQPRVIGEQIPLDPPPLPEPSPLPSVSPRPIADPRPIATVRNVPGTSDDWVMTDPLPIAVPSPQPLPTPDFIPAKPQFEPRAPRPLGSPSTWVTSNDYPSRDLREGNQGVVAFRLSVGSDGRVTACAVTVSSGFPGLDAATCDNVSRRARFAAATDSGGALIAGSYAGRIRWVIPQ